MLPPLLNPLLGAVGRHLLTATYLYERRREGKARGARLAIRKSPASFILPPTLLISRRMRVIWRHEISLHRHSRPRVHPRRDMLSGWGRPVVLQFQYGLLSLVTQSIVSSSPYDRLSLSKFARPVVCLAGRLPLSQMSRPLLSSHLLQVVACLTFF